VPCIFWWPGQIEADTISNGMMYAVDLFSTFASLGGGAIPADRPIDGIDQSGFLLGRQNNSDREGAVGTLDLKARPRLCLRLYAGISSSCTSRPTTRSRDTQANTGA
jgi:hypothetical protein